MDHYLRARQKLNIDTFNRMQVEAFEVIPKGGDTMLLSVTGSGKTIAFLLPVLAQVDLKLKRTQALIIAPTRELALQITSVISNLAMGVNALCCYGGHPVRIEKKALESNPEVVIGTPGRILDHLEREHFDPLLVQFLVLDEFDKTLEMGFHKQMEGIVKHFKYKPQYILTSATDTIDLPAFLPLYELSRINYIAEVVLEGLRSYKVFSPTKDKLETLYLLLNDIAQNSTFVFCNYRESVARISEFLSKKGITNDYFHGGLNQIDRENVLSKFRNGSCSILITTDLAGRGLDIPQVENVVHYHLPESEEVFTHRNGRTARMDAEGDAYVIIAEGEATPDYIDRIQNEYKTSGSETELPSPQWTTLLINKGKREKIRKGDVVGFLFKIGQLGKDDLGLIEVKDNYSLAAVHKNQASLVVKKVNNQKIKGKKALVRIL